MLTHIVEYTREAVKLGHLGHVAEHASPNKPATRSAMERLPRRPRLSQARVVLLCLQAEAKPMLVGHFFC